MSRAAAERRALELSRRRFLQWAAAVGLTSVARPLRLTAGGVPALPDALFLSPEDYAVIRDATALIFPSDDLPGALEAGVADYIQRMLSLTPTGDANCDGRVGAPDVVAVNAAIAAGASDCPAADVDVDGGFDAADLDAVRGSLFPPVIPVFAGGPFSGRQPFVDPETMAPSEVFPANAFVDFVPLNRVQQVAWEARMNGTVGTPELARNPLASGTRVNLRGQYRNGIAAIAGQSQQLFQAGFSDLTPEQQLQVLARPTVTPFARLLRLHTMEGLFAAPEYGGNRNRIGWGLIDYGGDSQPLGYTLGFDEESATYVEREDRPNSRPDPGEDCAGLSSTVIDVLKTLIATQPEFTEFPEPFCFGV